MCQLNFLTQLDILDFLMAFDMSRQLFLLILHSPVSEAIIHSATPIWSLIPDYTGHISSPWPLPCVSYNPSHFSNLHNSFEEHFLRVYLHTCLCIDFVVNNQEFSQIHIIILSTFLPSEIAKLLSLGLEPYTSLCYAYKYLNKCLQHIITIITTTKSSKTPLAIPSPIG